MQRADARSPVRSDRHMRDILYGDVPTFMELPHARSAEDLAGVGSAFLGMGYEGVKILSTHEYLPDAAAPAGPNSIYYRTGADAAPEAVRRYAIHYSIHHSNGLFIEYDDDFYIFEHLSAVDAGDVDIVPGDPQTSFERCEARVREIVCAGAIPLVCGGDHATTLPVCRGLTAAREGHFGLIQLDSHYDLCLEPPHYAGSQFAQILDLPAFDPANFVQIGMRGIRQVPFEVEVAKELGHTVLTMADIDQRGIEAVIEDAVARASDGTDGVYLTLDIDVVDPVYCPAQKYPEPSGLTSKQLISALRGIGQAADIVGFDLCCLGPQYDDRVGTGSHLAARSFLEVLATIASRRRKG